MQTVGAGSSVSIPIGFSHQLRRAHIICFTPLKECFNPYRVFSSAETYTIRRRTFRHIPVSIPIGFSHQLRLYPFTHSTTPSAIVSIPIGFSHQLRLDRFRERFGVPLVSIPIGFSHQLRRLQNRPYVILRIVSIPIGFSHQLRLIRRTVAVVMLIWFQSLSGFLIS